MNEDLRDWLSAACCPPITSAYLDNFEASERARWNLPKPADDESE